MQTETNPIAPEEVAGVATNPEQAVVVVTTSNAPYVAKRLNSDAYTIDAMTLRSMMRADVGVVVLNDGVIEFKADVRDI
jgi:hypothetical protein